MKKIIDQKTIKHLCKLARLEISSSEEKSLLEDLNKILDYVEELKEVQKEEKLEEKGAKELRKDEISLKRIADRDELVDSFYERKDYYLKIPAVFKRKKK